MGSWKIYQAILFFTKIQLHKKKVSRFLIAYLLQSINVTGVFLMKWFNLYIVALIVIAIGEGAFYVLKYSWKQILMLIIVPHQT